MNIPNDCPVPSREQAALNERLGVHEDRDLNPVHDLGRETAVKVRGVTIDTSTATIWNGGGEKPGKGLGSVRIVVWCEMDFKDRHDSGANVEVIRRRDGSVSQRTSSTAWNGKTFVEMPEGARRRVAEFVRSQLGDIDWSAIAREAQLAEVARESNFKLSQARKLVEAAEEMLDFTPHAMV